MSAVLRMLTVHPSLGNAQGSLEYLLNGWFGSVQVGKQPVTLGTYQVGLLGMERSTPYDVARYEIVLVSDGDLTGISGLLDGASHYGKGVRPCILDSIEVDTLEHIWRVQVRCMIEQRGDA